MSRGVARLKELVAFYDEASYRGGKKTGLGGRPLAYYLLKKGGVSRTKIRMPSASPFHVSTSSLSCFSDFLSERDQNFDAISCWFSHCAPAKGQNKVIAGTIQ